MSVTINFDYDDSLVRAALRDVPKQARFAAALALTRVAKKAQAEAQDEMRSAFDRPVPYTIRSLAIRPATKQALTSEVFFRDFAGKGTPARKYMFPQVYGGQRRVKRFERSLQSAGVLPLDKMAYPAAGADIDRYGNMNRGQITKILSALRATSDATQHAGRGSGRGSRRNERYFVGGRGPAAHLVPGIYRADGAGVVPVLAFGKPASYEDRFAFHDVVQSTAHRGFAAEFEKALAHALATAKR